MFKKARAKREETKATNPRGTRHHKVPRVSLNKGDLGEVLGMAASYSENSRTGCIPYHVSTLTKTDFCFREAYYASMTAPDKESIKASQNLMFKTGLLHEQVIVDSLIRAYGRERFYGKWSCDCGETTHNGWGREEKYSKRCGNCKTKCRIYKQVDITAPFITGHADVIWLNPQNEVEVIEIKSASADRFKMVESAKQPFENAMTQAYAYSQLIKGVDFGHKLSEHISFIYSNRAGSPYKNPFLHLKVKISSIAGATREFVDNQIKQAFENSKLPDADPNIRYCETIADGRKRGCKFVDQCFASKKYVIQDSEDL